MIEFLHNTLLIGAYGFNALFLFGGILLIVEGTSDWRWPWKPWNWFAVICGLVVIVLAIAFCVTFTFPWMMESFRSCAL